MGALGNKTVFARNLRHYIEQSGKDRRELAEIWGFPYSTLSEWLNARKYPRIDRIEIMADYFGILKSDLIEEKMTPEKEKDNDILADIIVRMRMEKDFREAVESLYLLDASRIKGVKQLLQAFTQQPENKV
jgi:transcriptional regulator with XRE-family HTH domain